MHRWLSARTAGLLIIAPAFLAACSNGSSETTSQPTAPAAEEVAAPTETLTARNPVDILRKIDGCELPEGTETGETSMQGYRFASCDFMDLYPDGSEAGTNVTVYTALNHRPELGDLHADDSHKLIQGEDFLMSITGDFADYSKHIKPQQIAAAVDGTVVTP